MYILVRTRYHQVRTIYMPTQYRYVVTLLPTVLHFQDAIFACHVKFVRARYKNICSSKILLKFSSFIFCSDLDFHIFLNGNIHSIYRSIPTMFFRNISFATFALLLATPGYAFATPKLAANRNNGFKNYAFDKNADAFNGLNALSVTELKRLLSERGVDFRDCLEKRELVERLQSSKAALNNPPITGGLSEQENSLISTFKRVSPSVANVKTTTLVPQQRGLQLRGLEVPSGSGSGFLWDEKGHVVTNYHVVSAGRRKGNLPRSVKVKLSGMAEALDADVVGVEPEKDLAVLKVRDTRNLPRPIDVGISNDLQVGQSVMAIGVSSKLFFAANESVQPRQFSSLLSSCFLESFWA